jgi:cytochrome c oxidase subunit I+III
MALSEEQARIGQLQAAWARASTPLGRLASVSHRSVGARYMLTSAAFFALAGLAALVMRVQLAAPEQRVVGAETYDQLFTMHGVTMMFLFAVPAMQGFAIYLVPLMLGTRELAFPRLNAFGYWLYLLGGGALWISLIASYAPDAGWFDYPPLASARFSPAANIDVYAAAVPLVQVSAIVAAVVLAVTILTRRAPGMSLNRMPLFVWAVLVMAGMIVLAMPPLILDGALLILDRNASTDFFNSGAGGDPLLWQHLFWFFGHPEVYLMLLPGLGTVAMITSTFARHPTSAYPLVATSYVLIGAISFGVWAHHMFTTGESIVGLTIFSAATMTVVIPSGIHVFSMLSTLRHGRMRISVPLLYALAFVFIFIIGGLTGIQLASVPADWQVHDSYFVVAHFHYTLLGGVVMPLLAGTYYWFPKFTGRMLDDRIGYASFALVFAGTNLAFFPMHLAGLEGMPRRVYTYPAGLGWDHYQQLATIGAFLLGAGLLVYLANLVIAYRTGPRASANPWAAGTLEWLPDSPPPDYAFAGSPRVQSAYPLWDEHARPTVPDQMYRLTAPDRKESLETSSLEALPERRIPEPGATLIPLLAGLATAIAFLGTIFDPLWFLVGAAMLAALFVNYAWREPTSVASETASTPVPRSLRYGMGGLLVATGSLFTALFSAYGYLVERDAVWPVAGLPSRPIGLGIAASVAFLAAAGPLELARRSLGASARAALLLGVSVALMLAGLALLAVDAARLDYNWASNATASLEWALTGIWALSALALIVVLATAALRLIQRVDVDRISMLIATVWYGRFVLAVWVPVFAVVYLGGRVL